MSAAGPRNILPELEARGLIADVSNRDELGALLGSRNVINYVGHDPTADSLHVGHLVPIAIQRHLQRAGHSPFALVGGATGMIGDPSGKSEERNLLDRETLSHNVARLHAQLSRLLASDEIPVRTFNNLDFYQGMNVLDFLRDIGKHFTVNHMMAKESVRARLEDREAGISFTEFSYMLLQAYDFVSLAREGCRLQIGGSDQWGNIVAGIDLNRRKSGAEQLYGFTTPLLLDSSGQKMGKTATGEKVWLDGEKTSPYAFFQYFVNVDDVLAPALLKKFSFRPLEELDAIIAAHAAEPGKRTCQRELAKDVTRWVHGDAGLRRAEVATGLMFGGSLDELKDDDLDPLAGEIGCTDVPRAELEAGIDVVELLVRAGLTSSKGEARRLLGQGGVTVGKERGVGVDRSVTTRDLGTASYLLLRSGKKNYRLIRAR
jgi:tyrosyl-tRNA synthetase